MSRDCFSYPCFLCLCKCFPFDNYGQKVNISVERTQHPKPKVPNEKLGFGKVMSDHMLEIDFDGSKWSEPRIVPYHNLSLDPATSVFHYATEVQFSLRIIISSVSKV